MGTRSLVLCCALAVGMTGCKQVSDLFEPELDDSAEGMSGTWEIVSTSAAQDDCEQLSPTDVEADSVSVRIEELAESEAPGADSSSEADPEKLLWVESCAGEDCGPLADRYSRFEKAGLGWSLDEYRADWSRYPACLVRRVQATFVPLPDGKARIEIEQSRGEGLVEGTEDCDHEFARQRRETMSCHYRRTIELRRPDDAAS